MSCKVSVVILVTEGDSCWKFQFSCEAGQLRPCHGWLTHFDRWRNRCWERYNCFVGSEEYCWFVIWIIGGHRIWNVGVICQQLFFHYSSFLTSACEGIIKPVRLTWQVLWYMYIQVVIVSYIFFFYMRKKFCGSVISDIMALFAVKVSKNGMSHTLF